MTLTAYSIFKLRSLPIMPRFADVTGAGDGELERVDVQPLLVGVGEEADKVVLLQALRVVLVVNVGAGGAGIPGWE